METKQSKTEFWSKHLADAKVFAGTKEGYCEAHGLKVATFYGWKKKLQDRTKPRKQAAFLPAVIAEPRRELSKSSLPEANWVAEVMAHFVKAML